MVVADELKQVADVRRVDVAWRARVDGLLALTVHGSHHAVALSSRQVLMKDRTKNHTEPRKATKTKCAASTMKNVRRPEAAQAHPRGTRVAFADRFGGQWCGLFVGGDPLG